MLLSLPPRTLSLHWRSCATTSSLKRRRWRCAARTHGQSSSLLAKGFYQLISVMYLPPCPPTQTQSISKSFHHDTVCLNTSSHIHKFCGLLGDSVVSLNYTQLIFIFFTGIFSFWARLHHALSK